MLAAVGGGSAAAASLCAGPDRAIREMVSTEYAFAAKAKDSVRGAFLAFLAPDALVLQPYPRPAVPLYTAAKDSADSLEWYPTRAEIAASGNLGYTSGPWTVTPAGGGARRFGHFVTVWRRDALCAWHMQLDAGVAHAATSMAEPPLTAAAATFVPSDPPAGALITANAYNHAIEDFMHVAQSSGLAAAFRTYGHDGMVRLYVDELPPLDGPGPVNEYLAAHPMRGVWKESGRGRSGDATLVYSCGEIFDGNAKPTHSYVQVWVYDPNVANWGLRLLLLSRLSAH